MSGSNDGRRFPLYARVLVGVVAGVVAALIGGERVAPLAELGTVIIRLLKVLATPLVMLAVLEAFLKTEIPARKAGKLLSISLLNALVAISIGLLVANTLRGGESIQGRVAALSEQLNVGQPASAHTTGAQGATLNPLANFAHFVPESLIEPFSKNNVITVVLFSLALGAALRKIRSTGGALTHGVEQIELIVRTLLSAFAQILEWVVLALPFAVFGVIAGVVARTGPQVFVVLGVFLATVLLGLTLHAVVYYAVLLRVVAGYSPIVFFRGALDAIVTALSCGSSLATLPVTLKCLDDNLRVSAGSSRLAACVGTNLNHDGIILYEAATAIFVAQAFGFPLTMSQQVTIGLGAVMAGVGIAGVPEAGLITLPLVLGAAGLPESVVVTAIPLLLPVDWLIGRFRAATNVTSDMTVAVILDRSEQSQIQPPESHSA